MTIIDIVRAQKTKEEDYTVITFKNWFGKTYTEVCITYNRSSQTFYAKSGELIPLKLWDTVKAFLRTGDKFHDYEN